MAVAIDTVAFDFHVLKQWASDVHVPPADGATGVYVTGMFLEGAAWSVESEHLVDQRHGQLLYEMPVIWFKPSSREARRTGRWYDCPVYKTAKRSGKLSTTGHSTNFVVTVQLNIAERHTVGYWVKRGAALLCQPYEY